jgi:WG containing repeat
MRYVVFLVLASMIQIMNAQPVLMAGRSSATLQTASRLVASVVVLNHGTATANDVEAAAVSLEGAKLTTTLPIRLGAIRAGGQAVLETDFRGDFVAEKSYLIQVRGSFLEADKTVPFTLAFEINPSGPSGSTTSSSPSNTTTGERNLHEPPNFQNANPSRSWVVPTGPARSATGAPETSARPPSEKAPVKIHTNASVGSSPSENLVPMQVNGFWGYADRSGALKIPAKFGEAGKFYNGFARVKLGQKYGVITPAGNFVLNPLFEGISEAASEGLIAVEQRKGAGWGFVDLGTGKIVIPMRFTSALPFHEGLAAVSSGGKWGYIDKSGAFRIPARFDEAGPFVNGVAEVKIEKNRTQVDRTGAVVPTARN